MIASVGVCEDVGAACSRANSVFFEPQSLAPQEQPYRIVPDLDPARGQLILQPMQRHMRRLADPPRDKGAVRFQHHLAVTTHLARRDRAGRTIALRPLHDRGNRNAEPRRNRSAALTADKAATTRPRRSLERGRPILAGPRSSQLLNHDPSPNGIPSRIPSIRETLRGARKLPRTSVRGRTSVFPKDEKAGAPIKSI